MASTFETVPAKNHGHRGCPKRVLRVLKGTADRYTETLDRLATELQEMAGAGLAHQTFDGWASQVLKDWASGHPGGSLHVWQSVYYFGGCHRRRFPPQPGCCSVLSPNRLVTVLGRTKLADQTGEPNWQPGGSLTGGGCTSPGVRIIAIMVSA